MSFEILQSLFRSASTSTPVKLDMDSFQLISKLPYAPMYNHIQFIPTLIKNNPPPSNGNGLYFTKQIESADDIVLVAIKEFNNENRNLVEYRALGFHDRLREVMMTAARNPVCAKTKWISFNCNALGSKYGNNIIGLLENVHPDADPNLQVEYEIYNTVDGK
jgi:hypothetical protein